MDRRRSCIQVVDSAIEDRKVNFEEKSQLAVDRKENNMDAVKFFKEYERMCDSHNTCDKCPANDITGCAYNPVKGYRDINIIKVVEIVEKWSKENPEELGKKYIIEIDEVQDNGFSYRIKGTECWLDRKDLKNLEEYNESEE